MKDSTGASNALPRAAAGLFAIGLILFCIYYVKSKSNYEEDVKKSYGKTIGWIVGYSDHTNSELGNTRSITYSYLLNKKIYTRLCNTSFKFHECDQGIIGFCTEKRFWVIFSKQDTSKSLINFMMEIQNKAEPMFPKSIDNFE